MTFLNILVIDQNAKDRSAIREALAGEAFALSEAETLASGLELARERAPDCVLLDCEMPGMHELTIVEELIPNPKSPATALVMLTREADNKIAALAMKKGAQDYLEKSRLQPYELRRAIRNAVDRLQLIADRKKAEMALAASEARYRSIVEDQTEMVCRFHADGTLTFVNAAYARAFGRTPSELLGTSLYDLVPSTECAFIRTAIAGLTQRNPVITHRHRAFAADSSLRWQEWTNRLLPKAEGKPDEYQGTGRDITERKRAEDALQESQERMAAILATAMDAIVTADENARIISFNPAAARLFRCAYRDAAGQPLDRFIPSLRPEFFFRIGEAPNEGDAPRALGDLHALRADGTELPIEASISTARVGARKIYAVILRDVSERKQAEAALRESEARFRGIFENAAIGLARVALDGAWLEVNHRLCEKTGYSRDELLALRFEDVVHREDFKKDPGTLSELLSGGIARIVTDKRFIRKDGGAVWAAVTLSLQRDDFGKPQYFIAAIRDINKRKRAEQALRESEERLGLFIEHAPAAIAMFDRDMRYLAASQRWRRDYKLEINPVGRSHYELFPENSERWKAVHRRCLAGAIENSDGEVFVRSDGSVQWRKWDCRPWRDASGEIGGILLAAEDITHRKLAEDALRISEERLSQAVAVAGIGVGETSDQSELIDASPALREMGGFDESEPITLETALSRVVPEDRDKVREHIARERDPAGEGIAAVEFRLQHPTRGLRWLNMRARASFEGEGAARHWVRSVGAVQDITSRRQAEEELRKATDRLRLALAAGKMGVWDCDLAKGDTYWDAAQFQLFGYEPRGASAPAGDLFRQSIHQNDRWFVAEMIERSKNKGDPFRAEFRIVRPDGVVCWLAGEGEVLFENGKPARMIGVNFDITERKQSEQALAEATWRLHVALAAGRMGTWDWDLINDKTVLDAAEYEVLGYTYGSPSAPKTGREFFALVHPEDRERLALHLERLKLSPEPFYDEFRIIRPDGAIRWIVAKGEMTPNADGIPERMAGVNFDITERKEAEEALRASEELFRTITATAQEGIWAIDLQARTIFANPRMAELLRTTPEEMVSKPVSAFCFPEDLPEAEARIAANLAGERSEFEFRFRRADGTSIEVLAATAPLKKGPAGEIIGGLGGFLDLAERKAAEEHQLFLMRELSHRSKNLLAIIQAIASQTARSATTLADFQERFGQRLRGIAASNDLLINQNWKSAPLEKLIRHQTAPFAGKDRSRLRTEGPDVRLTPAAAQALGLALHELATNSVKYGALSKDRGKVTVSWSIGEDFKGRRLRLSWREEGGPPVTEPVKKGFGTAVIEQMVAHSLQGDVMLSFDPAGLRWNLAMPLSHVVEFDSLQAINEEIAGSLR
ncbi:MAG TPA: PAS domain S-box protein [Methylocella sp.]|nr:PAS domain S-box protein [Methylocella sp.]